MELAQRLEQLRQRLALACQKHGRSLASVQLLAVSKQQSAASITAAYQQGLSAMGENYLNEARAKQQQLANYPISWHFIGQLQSNKTRAVAANFSWVHSVDQLKLAQRLSAQRPQQLPDLNVLLQVKAVADANKSGCSLEQLPELAEQVAQLPRLRLRGLMNMAPADQDPQPGFAKVAATFQQIAAQLGPDAEFDTLSMGMSADLEAAIAHGSTMVRIGSAIFGTRQTSDGNTRNKPGTSG